MADMVKPAYALTSESYWSFVKWQSTSSVLQPSVAGYLVIICCLPVEPVCRETPLTVACFWPHAHMPMLAQRTRTSQVCCPVKALSLAALLVRCCGPVVSTEMCLARSSPGTRLVVCLVVFFFFFFQEKGYGIIGDLFLVCAGCSLLSLLGTERPRGRLVDCALLTTWHFCRFINWVSLCAARLHTTRAPLVDHQERAPGVTLP